MRLLIKLLGISLAICLSITACTKLSNNNPPALHATTKTTVIKIGKKSAVKTIEVTEQKLQKHSYVQYGRTYHILHNSKDYVAVGKASWYGPGFNHHYTSSGERYNMYHMTAAHKTLPLKTWVRVTNLKNGRQIIVKVNDRGPFVGDRLIDLSYAAAKKLHMVDQGVAQVKIQAL